MKNIANMFKVEGNVGPHEVYEVASDLIKGDFRYLDDPILQNKDSLNEDEACAYLDCSKRKLNKHIKEGLDFETIGNKKIFSYQELRKIVEASPGYKIDIKKSGSGERVNDKQAVTIARNLIMYGWRKVDSVSLNRKKFLGDWDAQFYLNCSKRTLDNLIKKGLYFKEVRGERFFKRTDLKEIVDAQLKYEIRVWKI